MKLKHAILLILSVLPVGLSAQEILSLRSALELGLENRHAVRILKNEAEIASLSNSAGNAGMLPSVDLSGGRNASMNSTYQRTFAGDERDITNARNSSWNAGATLSWTLFDGMGMFIRKDQLDEMEAIGETRLRMGMEATVSEIITVYYSIVLQQEVIGVMEEATRLSRERLKIAGARRSLGAGARPAQLQATVDLNADSASLIVESALLSGLQARLNYLIGRDPLNPLYLSDTIPAATLPDFTALWAGTGDQGTELLLARQEQRLSEMEARLLRSYLYPSLRFGAGFGYAQLSAETGYLQYNRSFGPSYNVTVSYPLFNGFTARHAMQAAEIDLRSETLRTEDVTLRMRMEMYSLYQRYLADTGLIALESYNLLVAKENVEVAMEKYRLGSISDIELRETQEKLIEAQLQLIHARYRAKEAEAELRRMSGMLDLEAL